METVYFLLIMLLVIVLYAYTNVCVGGREYIQCVDAGPTKDVTAEFLKEKSFYDERKIVRDQNDKIVDTHNMMRIVVQGDCMKPKGIFSGDQLLVEKIDRKKTFEEQIKKGNIVLIYLADKGIYKIRIFEDYEEDGSLKTYHYIENKRRNSKYPHKRNCVLGKVVYKV